MLARGGGPDSVCFIIPQFWEKTTPDVREGGTTGAKREKRPGAGSGARVLAGRGGSVLDVAAAAVTEILPDQGQHSLVLRVVLIERQVIGLGDLGVDG